MCPEKKKHITFLQHINLDQCTVYCGLAFSMGNDCRLLVVFYFQICMIYVCFTLFSISLHDSDSSLYLQVIGSCSIMSQPLSVVANCPYTKDSVMDRQNLVLEGQWLGLLTDVSVVQWLVQWHILVKANMSRTNTHK